MIYKVKSYYTDSRKKSQQILALSFEYFLYRHTEIFFQRIFISFRSKHDHNNQALLMLKIILQRIYDPLSMSSYNVWQQNIT